ncbi:type I secretion system permease/ATPase [Sneathiella chinensis]|uniref:Peptide ABC transporter n=1 Tax=Sneathiella chinensis TaxID=349750 RepID=A0ABQ5U7Q2_9PROT|nr:type I secretion system permease/ATPase [Sneathiella chinensis]GLQ07934.1 peptide ABC transporter [Sneathiella chinensis]
MTKQKNTLLSDTLRKCNRVFLGVALFGLAINLLMLTAPLFMMQVFDRVISSRNTDTLLMLVIIAAVSLLTMASLEGVRSFVLVRLSSWLDKKLGGTALKASINSTLKQGKEPNIQGLRDLSTVRNYLTGASIFPILDAPFAPVFLGILFLLHPYLGAIATLGAVFLFGLALANEMLTRRPLMDAGKYNIAAMNHAEASARNADVIAAMGMMPNLIGKWHKEHLGALEQQGKASDLGGMISAVTKFIRTFLQITVSAVAALLVIQGEMTAGAMIASSIIMGRALAPVEQAISTWKGFLGARSAYGRLSTLLEDAPISDKFMPLPRPAGHVSVEGVTYIHPGSTIPVLRNVNFKLQAGESLGLIGPTASGKSTLARILVGNITPRTGHSRLDNMDVAEWAADDRGRYIGYLPQDIELFSGTIRENIARMGEGDPDDVVAAANKAGVHQMILRLEKGYETEIGDGGAALSGGQRQRIGLARALYGKPSLLVLDEPNANLDNAGESALMEAMRTLKQEGATVIVIAHRPNVLREVDKVLVLRGGTVDDFGDRDAVLERLQGTPPLIAAGGGEAEDKQAARQVRMAQLNAKKTGAAGRSASGRGRKAGRKDSSGVISLGGPPMDGETGKGSPPELTDDIRQEIRALAGRDLSDQEVEEIYGLYTAGRQDEMMKRLKESE